MLFKFVQGVFDTDQPNLQIYKYYAGPRGYN